MEHKLKPCPFCGHAPNYPSKIADRDRYVITHFCDMHIKEVTVCVTCYGKTPEEAIARWNERHTKPKKEVSHETY